MLPYNIIRSKVTPVTGNDLFTIISHAVRSFIIVEFDFFGMGTASADNEIGIYRVATAGVTGGGAIVPAPGNPEVPAFGGVVNTTWGTQPVVGTLVHTIGLNANGQRTFYRPLSMFDMITSHGGANAAGSLSIRPVSGTSPVTIRMKIAEL